MIIEQYFAALQAKIAEIAAAPEPIRRAAAVCSAALASGGVIHIFDSGHMVSSELVNRAGGLVALSALSFNLNVINPVKSRPAQADETSLSYAYIGHVFETNQLRKGDVLFVGSVSGKTANVVKVTRTTRMGNGVGGKSQAGGSSPGALNNHSSSPLFA